MQPKMCTKCRKNIAVVFITKMENGVTLNEGYCLKCARGLGIPQIDQAVRQMGISEDDLDLLTDEMSNMFGQRDDSEDADEDEIDSQTATFPLLNQLFGGNMPAQPQPPQKNKKEEPQEESKGKKKNKKHKFLDSYCMDLTGRARSGKLDKVIGRDVLCNLFIHNLFYLCNFVSGHCREMAEVKTKSVRIHKRTSLFYMSTKYFS